MEIAKFIVRIDNFLFGNSQISVDHLNHIVRKSAHFTAYLILAFTVGGVIRNLKVEKPITFAITMVIVVTYAISDEFHQLFVPGRSGEFRDILIDSSGGLIGALLALKFDDFILNLTKKYSNNKNRKRII